MNILSLGKNVIINIFCMSSYLNTLLVPINAVTTKLIEELKPLADGVTKVPMKLRFGDFTNDVISKVNLVVQDTKLLYRDPVTVVIIII